MTNKEIATIILQQLGGNRFIAMTGAHNFIAIEKGLLFRIPRSRKINRIIITLNANDYYDVSFTYVHGKKVTTQSTHIDISFDELQSLFTQQTGLYTSLGRVAA